MAADKTPEDIWLLIFDYIEGELPTDTATAHHARLYADTYKKLAKLALVSRKLYQIFKPRLYRHVNLWNANRNGAADFLLLRTLSENPAIGESIRAVVISTGPTHRGDHVVQAWENLQASPEPLPRIARDVYTGMVGFADPWTGGSGGTSKTSLSHFGSCTRFLLALMPKIELVELVIKYQPCERSFQLLGSEAPAPSPSPTTRSDFVDSADKLKYYDYPYLNEVRISQGTIGQHRTEIYRIEAIFLHPALRTLRLEGFDWRGESVKPMARRNEISHVRLLQLKGCEINALGFRHILSRCTSLVDFSIESLGNFADLRVLRSQEGDYQAIGEMLCEYGAKLEKLELYLPVSNDTQKTFLGRIRSLPSLRRLHVPRRTVLVPRGSTKIPPLPLQAVLPSSLETLHLLHACSNSVNPLEEESQMRKELQRLFKSQRLSNLKEIHGIVSLPNFGEDPPRFSKTTRNPWLSDLDPERGYRTAYVLRR